MAILRVRSTSAPLILIFKIVTIVEILMDSGAVSCVVSTARKLVSGNTCALKRS